MNKLITFIIASFVLAASAFADVGESPAVSLAEWRKLGVIPQGWETVEGQPCLSGQTSDGNMAIHVFTVDRKYNIACILVGASVTQGMIEHLKQSAPMNTWEQVYYNDTDGGMWRSSFKRDGHQYQRIIVARDRWIAITNKAGFDYLSRVWQSPSPARKNGDIASFPTDSAISYPTISRDFGLAWHVAQDTYISRRELSDQLLNFLADLKKRQPQKKI